MTALAISGTGATRPFIVLCALALLALAAPAAAWGSGQRHQSVYTLTNGKGSNAIAAFTGSGTGKLEFTGRTPTGGIGTGESLGSQGAVAVGPDRRRLFAVNPGSGSVSMLRLGGRRPKLLDEAPSGGQEPISLSVRGRRLYVLNSGQAGNVTTLAVRRRELSPRRSWTRPLGPGAEDPAQVGLSPDGRVLVVTEKDSDTIDTYPVDGRGRPGEPAAHPSTGAVPFGFDFDYRGRLLVSNASGSASSYGLGRDGDLEVITDALVSGQRAPCWLVTSEDGRYAYVANAQSASITGLRVRRDGSLRLLDPSGASAQLSDGSNPIDEAVGPEGRFLYVLNAGRRINAFRIGDDGDLRRAPGSRKAPRHAAGLAAG